MMATRMMARRNNYNSLSTLFHIFFFFSCVKFDASKSPQSGENRSGSGMQLVIDTHPTPPCPLLLVLPILTRHTHSPYSLLNNLASHRMFGSISTTSARTLSRTAGPTGSLLRSFTSTSLLRNTSTTARSEEEAATTGELKIREILKQRFRPSVLKVQDVSGKLNARSPTFLLFLLV